MEMQMAGSPIQMPPMKNTRCVTAEEAKDPAKCSERVAKIREAHKKAAENCKSAQPDKHRECMRHEMCAQAKDPVKCEARAKAHAERRSAARKPSG